MTRSHPAPPPLSDPRPERTTFVKSDARTLTGAVLAAAMVTIATGQTSAVATPATPAASSPAAPSASRTLTAGTYLVGVRPGSLAAVTAGLRPRGLSVLRTLTAMDTVVAKVATGRVVQLSDPRIVSISRDATVGLASWGGSWAPSGDPNSLYSVAGTIGARNAWRYGVPGSGVGVALIDSGVSPEAGLATQGKIVQGPDLSLDSQSASVAHLDE